MKMRIPEFYKVYCADIEEKVKELKSAGFASNDYDDIIQDEETGRMVKVIYGKDETISVDDIFELSDFEFNDKYREPSSQEAKATYLKAYTITSGADALHVAEEAMKSELEKFRQGYLLQKELERDYSKPDEEGSAVARELYSGGW